MLGLLRASLPKDGWCPFPADLDLALSDGCLPSHLTSSIKQDSFSHWEATKLQHSLDASTAFPQMPVASPLRFSHSSLFHCPHSVLRIFIYPHFLILGLLPTI